MVVSAVVNLVRWRWGAEALHPAYQIKRDEHGFFAEGADPQFRLTGVLPAGWYWLEVGLSIPTARTVARIYLEMERGAGQEDPYMLPLRSGRVGKRLIRLSSPARVRFDPLSSPGRFMVEHFKLRRVPQWVACNRMQRKLRSIHPRYQSKADGGLHGLAKPLPADAIELWDEYQHLYAYNSAGLILYQEWCENIEFAHRKAFADEAAQAGEMHWQEQDGWPLISVLLPVYNTPAGLLQRCIDSVLRQTYPVWELCIADDGSTEEHVRQVLEQHAASDSRVKLVFCKSNGHISRASNAALTLAQGKYVALLDHDDELAEHALFCVARSIRNHADAQIIYSDEDKLDEEGARCNPYFKPDYSFDLLLSQNYFGHLCVLSRNLVEQVGGFRVGFEGSQDYDLILRCLAQLPDGRGVLHIPHVLYHWRMIEGSTALDPAGKAYAYEAARRALQEHVDTSESGMGHIEIIAPGLYRQCWRLPCPPLVSLIIPTRDALDVLRPCIDSILQRTAYTNYELLIVDNQSSSADALDYLERLQKDRSNKIRVLRYDRPFNYSAINNFAVAHANGDVLALVNNDIEVLSSNWLDEMVSQAMRPGVGCVGAKLYYPDGTLQHGGVILGIGGVAGHAHQFASKDDVGYFNRLRIVHNVSAVTGATLVVRKSVYQAVGGMDAANLAVAFNDVDFCLRVLTAGYRNVWTPYAELIHHESKTRGSNDTSAKQLQFENECAFMHKRWGELLKRDPYYNPNLSLHREDYSLCVREQ